MLTVKKILPACIAALFGFYVFYACKSVKPPVISASTADYAINNVSQQLVHFNHTPVAKIFTVDTIGVAPFKAVLSSRESYDGDGDDELTYQWTLDNQVISTEPNPTYTFESNGIYNLVLTVVDTAGKSSTDSIEIKVSNAIPPISFQVADNSTFFFDKPTVFRYAVDVQKKDGKEIDRENLRVTMKYIPKVAGDASPAEYLQIKDYSKGRNLMAANDCKTCHQVMGQASIPSFSEISERYWGNKEAIGSLAKKIINGGNGAWGEQVMSAHPQLSIGDATEIVKYVLSVSAEHQDMEIPLQGTEILTEHTDANNGGRYVFTALYAKTGTVNALTQKDMVVLRPSKVEAEHADRVVDMQKEANALWRIHNGSYFVLENIDLKDVHHIRYRYSSQDNHGAIEVRLDAPDGPMISTATYKTTGSWANYAELSTTITDPGGKHDLYFVFVKNDVPKTNLAVLDWIKFEGGNEVKVKEKTPPVKKKLTGRKPQKRIQGKDNKFRLTSTGKRIGAKLHRHPLRKSPR